MGLRSWIAMVNVTNSKWKPFTRIYYLRLLIHLMEKEGMEGVVTLLNAIRDGHGLARKINEYFDIYKMPIVRISIKDLLKLLTAREMEERRYLRLKKALQLIGEGDGALITEASRLLGSKIAELSTKLR